MTSAAGYRRDNQTVRLYGALLAFGFLNAVLGPALPYLRAEEHLSYVASSLHQVGFALGGGLAGLLASGSGSRLPRGAVIAIGLTGAGLTALGIAYGGHVAITLVAAVATSLLGTSAVIRIWAALSDAHRAHRSVALAEGEAVVSLGSIAAPLLIACFAGTVLTWRFAFLAGAAACAAAALTNYAGRQGFSAPTRDEQSAAVLRATSRSTLVLVIAVVALEFSLSFWLATYLSVSVGLPRQLAVLMVGGLYTANLAGRLLASRAARRVSTSGLLGATVGVAVVGLPVLLAAHGALAASIGVAVVGAAIGALFPLTVSLHVRASAQTADAAVGEAMLVASAGQIVGPLLVGLIAQAAGLRAGLLMLPVFALLAAAALRVISTRGPGARTPSGR